MQRDKNEEKIIWSIGEMDQLIDTFRSPMPSKVFTVQQGRIIGWPSFHVSEADPDGRYQSYEYSIDFDLEEACDLSLRIACIVSTPRYPRLDIMINGIKGTYVPYPTPSKDKEIKPAHALHASIYNREDTLLYLPASLFRTGSNRMTFVAGDEKPVTKITNEQAVLRLDRMADACGFHYGALELQKASDQPVQNQCELLPSVIYIKNEEGLLVEKCLLRLTNPKSLKSKMEGTIHLTGDNKSESIPYCLPVPAFGQVCFPFLLPDGEGMVDYQLDGDLKTCGSFRRKRKWKVYTTPHAHTDIGYTHRQWEVAERMCRNLDTALDMLKGEHKEHFTYIIDSTWQLEEYIHSRSEERVKELLQAIAAGKIGIPQNYVDLLTQLPTLEGLIHNGDFSDRFLEQIGVIADRTDIVDVASATMSYPAVLAGSGVKYLLHADNQDRGPFRFHGELHRHSPFWWKAPDGSRILTWLARMYCELKKVCGSPASVEAAERGLELWLMDYERDNYAPDAVILYGQEADNTDLDIRSGAFLAEWEKEVVYPRLIPSNGSSFFDYVMKFAETFEEYSGDEGAYWEDGAASSIKETITVRKAEAGIRCAEVLDSLAILHSPTLKFPSQNYEEAWKQVLLYEEHTWGAFLSGSDPESILQQEQWAVKEHMAKQAGQWRDRLLTQAASKISLMWNNNSREIVVYNPYSFKVEGMVEVEIATNETILDEQNQEAFWEECGRTQNLIRAGLWVNSLPAFSYRRYILESKKALQRGGELSHTVACEKEILENEWYRVIIDTRKGTIVSFYDKELRLELAVGSTLGQILYAHGGEGTTLIGNHPGLSKEGAIIIPCFRPVSAERLSSELGTGIVIKGLAELGELKATIRLPKREKSLWLEFDYDKKETDQLEAVYVDFPFALSEASAILSDSQVGWVDWHNQVLPGACKEWLPLQTSVLMRGEQCDIQIASPDALLFTVGTPVEGKWSSEQITRGHRIYSYVLNNYWRTNYKGSQGGRIQFRYAITSAKKIPFEQAYQFGWKNRQGLYAQRMSYQEFRKDVPKVYRKGAESCLLQVTSSNIIVSTIRGSKDGNGMILRLQETGGYRGDIEFDFGDKSLEEIIRTDHLERPMKKLYFCNSKKIGITLNPWEIATYKIVLK